MIYFTFHPPNVLCTYQRHCSSFLHYNILIFTEDLKMCKEISSYTVHISSRIWTVFITRKILILLLSTPRNVTSWFFCTRLSYYIQNEWITTTNLWLNWWSRHEVKFCSTHRYYNIEVQTFDAVQEDCERFSNGKSVLLLDTVLIQSKLKYCSLIWPLSTKFTLKS